LVYEGGESRDAELVAAMFTAIREFIRDSFSVGKNEHLDNLSFGERSIFLQRTDKVFMACVVRGNPPSSLKQDLQDALELMVVNSAEELDDFKGDPAPFKKNRPFFQPFLVARYEEKPRKLPFIIRLIPMAIFLILLCLLGVHLFNRNVDNATAFEESLRLEQRMEAQIQSRNAFEHKVNTILLRLDNVHGLVVARVTKLYDGYYEIVCLKDELSIDPYTLITGNDGLSPSSFNLVIKPYVSMDPEIVRQRIINSLDAPNTMTLDFDTNTGKLTLTGEASLGWILRAFSRSQAIADIKSIDTQGIRNDDITKMKELINNINGVIIHFPLGKADPVPEDVPLLAKAMDELKELEDLAPKLQVNISLAIYGHADSTGQALRNYELSLARTKTVAALLYARGSFMTIRNFGMGSEFSKTGENEENPLEDPDSRKIELRVFVEGAGTEAANYLGLDTGPSSSIKIDAIMEINPNMSNP
jgi:OOP family OmpA-OmpF porin